MLVKNKNTSKKVECKCTLENMVNNKQKTTKDNLSTMKKKELNKESKKETKKETTKQTTKKKKQETTKIIKDNKENSKINKKTNNKKKSINIQSINNKSGYLDSIKDNICLVTGLSNCFIGEILYIYTQKLNKFEGLVLNIEEDYVKIVLIKGSQTLLRSGDPVYRTHSLVKTKAGFFVLGRIMNPVGDTLNPSDISTERSILDKLLSTDYVVIDIVAPGIIKRMSVKKPFLTGVTSVDCFIPIGCGQRELIIGDNNTGKTSLAITALLNQRYMNNISL
jgi:F-type H+/Na+-transporting ATPase subunit alpha